MDSKTSELFDNNAQIKIDVLQDILDDPANIRFSKSKEQGIRQSLNLHNTPPWKP